METSDINNVEAEQCNQKTTFYEGGFLQTSISGLTWGTEPSYDCNFIKKLLVSRTYGTVSTSEKRNTVRVCLVYIQRNIARPEYFPTWWGTGEVTVTDDVGAEER